MGSLPCFRNPNILLPEISPEIEKTDLYTRGASLVSTAGFFVEKANCLPKYPK